MERPAASWDRLPDCVTVCGGTETLRKTKFKLTFSLCVVTDINQLNEVCLECICDDYRGTGCDINDLCGRDRTGDCDLLGIDRSYWVTAGQPMVVGKEADVDFGERFEGGSGFRNCIFPL